MNKARIIVLGVALAAGGAAMLFGSGGQRSQQAVVQAILPPPPQIETDDVLTAARELPMGTLVTEADFAWTAWPKGATGAGTLRRSELPNIMADLKGSVSRASFIAGEPIRREKLVKGPNAGFLSAMLASGARAVAINIDAQGSTSAGGFILPNDRVDVLRTFRDEEGGKEAYATQTLLSNIRVLAIGQNVQEKNGQPVVVGSNATLEVDPRQAEILILAQRVGQLSLVLRSMLDSGASGAPSLPEAPDTSLTIVRAGVASMAGKK